MKAPTRHLSVLGLAVAGLLVGLALAEGVVRIVFPHSRDHVIPGGIFEMDARLGWRLRAGGTGTHRARHFETRYVINSRGFRDRERDPSPRPGKRRLLLYGDSQVFGWGVEERERFSNLVEARREDLEVWNMAVPGYGLGQEVISYRLNGRLLNADDVVLFVSEPTLGRAHRDRMYRKAKPMFRIDPGGELRLVEVPTRSRAVGDLVYTLLSPFYLPYFLERRLMVFRPDYKERFDPETGLYVRESREGEPISELDRRILLLARDTALEYGHGITVLGNLAGARQQELRAFCAEHRIGFLPIDIEEGDKNLTLGPYDRHWNPRGHELVAETLSRLE